MHRILFPFWMGLLLFSCNSRNRDQPEESTEGKAVSVSFEKLNSVRIDYLGNPTVHDIDPVSGNRLSDFEPKGLIASSMVLRNGELWMREFPNEEVEQDYFRLFRVGLKVEKVE